MAHLVEVGREIWRVLTPTGTFWLNIGDSYAGSNCGSNDYREKTGLGATPTTKYKGQKPSKAATGMYRLKEGLSPEEETYVLAELAKAHSICDLTQEGRE